jgi:hypothetical protein
LTHQFPRRYDHQVNGRTAPGGVFSSPNLKAAAIAQRPLFCPKGPPAMSFAVRNLSVLAYANGFTLWHYKAGNDPLDRVETPDFFADAADMLAEGDMLVVSATDGGRTLFVAQSGPGALATARPA